MAVIETDSVETGELIARNAGLVYVCDSDPGIHRLRRGKGFHYRHADGTAVSDDKTLERIRHLAIPPAYADVWICMRHNGHLQATGRDARRRKQYRYHPMWSAARDQGKFSRVIELGESLPRLRRSLTRDLKQRGLPRDKVLALLVAVMAQTLIRVGNDEYARDNHAYGLTTLRSKHAQAHRGRLTLQFRGKGGKQRELNLTDRRLVRLVKRIQQLPGQRLFQYQDDDGQRQPIDSGMLNDYLREATGGAFTAKDFRTFGATSLALAALAATPLPQPETERALKSAMAGVVKQVASVLGNTPAVCRNSYIDPVVFEGWQDGTLQRLVPTDIARHPRKLEQRTVAFLKRMARCRRRTHKRKR